MVGDFNEFCAVVPNPVERLHLKQFVKTYSTSIESTITSAMCTKDKDTEDDLVKSIGCLPCGISLLHYCLFTLYL